MPTPYDDVLPPWPSLWLARAESAKLAGLSAPGADSAPALWRIRPGARWDARRRCFGPAWALKTSVGRKRGWPCERMSHTASRQYARERRIDKEEQSSDWGAPELTVSQLNYAGTGVRNAV